ncbi:MAG: exodeoxyribonuclease V subunit gamma, partial [Caldimonas sp.]
MTADIRPGLIVLHGNRLELLRDAVSDWLSRRPLEPLEEEVFLVQSNGAAEWLKMALALRTGICAATRLELPARFLWRSYRQMLGPGAVAPSSPLEKSPLIWRLMRLLPSRSHLPAFAPITRFLNGNDVERRLQLAERLADLYDQYQVYRADWLEAWAAGRDVLRSPSGADLALPADQRWQAALWRDVLAELSDVERHATRAQVHRDFLAALASGAEPQSPLPRRVVLFGASHLPGQTLEGLAALSQRVQVLLAIPNPCRFHWADIIDGRELMRPGRRRHGLRSDRDLAVVPLEAMHAHAHPLLAAWGRQGRDFMR